MQPIYVLLLTLIVYFLFGRMVDAVLTTQKTSQELRIKVKVLFHIYIAPLMFGLVIMFFLFPGLNVFSILFGSVIILRDLVMIFTTKRMYITEMKFDRHLLKITFLTRFLKPGSKEFNLADISCMELENANWLMDFPAVVNMKYKEDWEKFEIIDRTLKAIVRNNVEAANRGLREIEA